VLTSICSFARDPLYEIEVRVKDVDARAFAHVLARLDSFQVR
jgi:hypothetical protein